MIHQHLYGTIIRNTVWKEVTNYDTFQGTKLSNKKYSKLPAKETEEMPRKKIYIDLIGIYVIRKNG